MSSDEDQDTDVTFEEYYLATKSNENCKNSTPIQQCSSLRNSMVRLHNEGLKTLSNEASCLLLKEHLVEYMQLYHDDNSNSKSVNSLDKPIEFLLKGKVSTRHCSTRKSNLRDCGIDINKLINENLRSIDYCNIESDLPCNSDEISEENLKWLFKKKTISDNTINEPISFNNHCKKGKFFNVSNESAKAAIKQPIKFMKSIETPNQTIDSNDDSDFKNDNISSSFKFKRPYASTFKKEVLNKGESFVNKSKFNTSVNNSTNIETKPQLNFFKTASAELLIQNKKNGKPNQCYSHDTSTNNVQKRSLGTTRSVQSKFIPPFGNSNETPSTSTNMDVEQDERLKHIDPKMVELIMSEIIDSSASVEWDDIAGLQFAKTAIQEAVVWPLLRPDIFTGLRRPPRGILLFGPPGTGKTLIGKCIASQCCATFFSISASSLTSKWLGDGEKMVRALFAVARCHQPAVVFIDEIDSLLTQRSDTEHEATRRIKTEFLVQLDGASTGDNDRFLLIGATNRPQELDEAARRRLVKRLYIPLPDFEARKQMVCRLMSNEKNSLSEEDIDNVAQLAEGFSGADMRSLCGEAALGPIRMLPISKISNIQSDEVRPISLEDFKIALKRVRPSVSSNDLDHYKKWDITYGSGTNHE